MGIEAVQDWLPVDHDPRSDLSLMVMGMFESVIHTSASQGMDQVPRDFDRQYQITWGHTGVTSSTTRPLLSATVGVDCVETMLDECLHSP